MKNTILKDFSFQDNLPDALTTLANEIENSNSICLHVRRGDYVSHPNANKFHGVKGIDYFDTAISLIAQTLTDIKIYVFSDDITWCIQNLKLEFITTFVEYEYPHRKPNEYFRLMILCKHFIISNSSFSWWAAWLNQDPQKIVIAPKKWFNDPMIDTSDLIPDNWIAI
ncbi:alpha-1,2-fucosyltransferase [Leptolyngbya subtilissima]|uniref:alpha-1,2-fucosyltransferase n=1 Tax=Leptolyngbya subtilissima TaxID=1346803 RepID=UPI003D651A10